MGATLTHVRRAGVNGENPLADARGYALSPLSRLLVWVIRVFPKLTLGAMRFRRCRGCWFG